jgi:hypothetical protein
MRRLRFNIIILIVVLSAGTGPLVVPAERGTQPGAAQTNATPASNAPNPLTAQGDLIGQRLDSETFGIRLENATTPAERAQIIAGETIRAETRLTRLQQRFETVQSARQSGSTGPDTYETRTTLLLDGTRALDARVSRIQTAANQTNESELSQAGVSRERINRLESRTDQLRQTVEADAGPGGLDRGFYRQVRLVTDQYNEAFADEDLGVLGTYLRNERVNVQIVRADGAVEVVSFRMTDETQVRDLRAGAHENATVQARMDEATARRIVNSDTPVDAANRAFLSGEIDVQGLTSYNRIKWLLTNTLADAARTLIGGV